MCDRWHMVPDPTPDGQYIACKRTITTAKSRYVVASLTRVLALLLFQVRVQCWPVAIGRMLKPRMLFWV
jgi:hypothetical protein